MRELLPNVQRCPAPDILEARWDFRLSSLSFCFTSLSLSLSLFLFSPTIVVVVSSSRRKREMRSVGTNSIHSEYHVSLGRKGGRERGRGINKIGRGQSKQRSKRSATFPSVLWIFAIYSRTYSHTVESFEKAQCGPTTVIGMSRQSEEAIRNRFSLQSDSPKVKVKLNLTTHNFQARASLESVDHAPFNAHPCFLCPLVSVIVLLRPSVPLPHSRLIFGEEVGGRKTAPFFATWKNTCHGGMEEQ